MDEATEVQRGEIAQLSYQVMKMEPKTFLFGSESAHYLTTRLHPGHLNVLIWCLHDTGLFIIPCWVTGGRDFKVVK